MGAQQSTETPWLTGAQQEAWRTLVSLVTRLPAALDTQLQRDSELTHFEYFVLAVLSEAPDRRLRLSELAFQANASLSRLSHVVTRLEKRGWARRETVAGTRGAFAVLTDEGYDKVVEAAPGHVATVQALVFEGLDDKQVMQLSTLGKALVDQLDRGIAAGTGKA
ncbi:MarR family transcriptional regulator [Rhodococcus hoagii]|uniref:Transcriptional regulator, MarR family n=3 Tax=Rhodococcus hoagii TaxID=43767 RepID=E9SZW2_RHOHA|nr:MarR family transcriptional regulator [Prescottella equi]MBU4613899.1 MarR family transcriptional regulator [Rhodococcus sp. GG48]MCD7053535.1 MarR family transcriptional regulator [Rhodococcus sp. BH2-1]GBF13687.1 marR family protein [Rhodococcus sp. Br-6]AVP68885.1 MarR family transcriptional regulator [Prescottella equi]EGD24545.1 transcriptional regulator, MarR family [Prescottella equi ATCC 33707]